MFGVALGSSSVWRAPWRSMAVDGLRKIWSSSCWLRGAGLACLAGNSMIYRRGGGARIRARSVPGRLLGSHGFGKPVSVKSGMGKKPSWLFKVGGT